MTIASEIQRIKTNIANAYTACDDKGATMPVTQNSANLADCIDSIQSGGSFVGIPREVSATGVYQPPSSNFTFSLPSNATDIAGNAMYYAFLNCTGVTSVDLSSLTTVSNNYAMYNAFYGCTNLTSVDLSSLTTVSNTYAMTQTFGNCSSLTSLNFKKLRNISGSNPLSNLVNGSSNFTSIYFPYLRSNSFGSPAKDVFSYMLAGVTGCTVHFPSNLQSVIGSWSSVTSGFNGTNTTVLYDLPATT